MPRNEIEIEHAASLKDPGMSLEGKIAIVTGAGRGIGFRIARCLREQGASVVFNDKEASEIAIQYIQDSADGRKAIFNQADVSRLTQIEEMVECAMRHFGHLDILVNNAGIDPTAPFLQVAENVWQHVIDTNLKSTFFCAQKAAAKMCKTGQGRIVNISSIHSHATMPGFSVYAASKGAINALTRELAVELAPLRISVNAIAPGAIEVERFINNPVYNREALAAEIPAGRVGKPEDVSNMVAFLCSDEAAWVTGQIISIDGGTLARLFLYANRPIPSGTPERTVP